MVDESWQEKACQIAGNIRRRVLEHVIQNNGGYMSQACSSAEIFATLYSHSMRLGPSLAPMIPEPFKGVPGAKNPHPMSGALYNGGKSPELDRFIFSPAHYALVLYATLIEVGRLAEDGLKHFNRDGSTVEMIGAEHSPGVEVTCGSLPQALSQALGIALARRRRGDTGRIFVFMSDGEFQEGQTWEAFEMMDFYHLDKLVIYVDVNGQQCDGRMCDVFDIEPLQQKLEAFGARVFNADGHDVEAIAAPANLKPDGRAMVVLCRTDPTRGLSIMNARAPRLHYLRFKDESERETYRGILNNWQSTCREG